MTNTNPATPAQAATPGSSEQNATTPQVATPSSTGNQGANPEEMITVPAKQYRNALRDQARLQAFNRRANIFERKNTPPLKPDTQNFSGDEDPDLMEILAQEQNRRRQVERELLQEQVTNKVRDIISKDKYTTLP